jgi:LytR cell envelope-related transcriptional attenuator
VNFGSARILVIVALIVAGVGILASGFGHGVTSVGATGANITSPSPSASTQPTGSTSPSPATLPSPQPVKDVKIAVFNGTSSAGLAAQAQQTLTTAGYVAGQDPANSPVQGGAPKTVIYYRGGATADQNKADAQNIADKYFNGAKVQLLGGSFPGTIADTITVTIVLGQDYASAHGA